MAAPPKGHSASEYAQPSNETSTAPAYERDSLIKTRPDGVKCLVFSDVIYSRDYYSPPKKTVRDEISIPNSYSIYPTRPSTRRSRQSCLTPEKFIYAQHSRSSFTPTVFARL